MNTKDYDYLIIGQGLAGSLMAWHLAEQKQNVLVIDNNHTASSSSVAAGIINPITGHRLNLTNEFTNYWRVAKPLYQELERFFDARILHPLNQTRVIKNAGQAEYLTKRLKDPGYASYLEKLEGDAKPLKEKGYGFANIKECWRVDLNLLLLELRNWLIAQNQYIADKIDYSQIEFNNDEVSLTLEKQQQTIRAKGIIFCEGYQAIHNPWLSHLPFKLAKGDIAKLSLKKQKTAQAIEPKNKLLNWGKWLMQDKPDQYLLGSSYQWGDTGLDKSPDELEKLITSLEQNTSYQSTDFTVEHQVGIRPSTTYRQAFVGSISQLAENGHSAYCFNGLGSKGCLIAPLHAAELSQHILQGETLPEELSRWL